jgi:hypothetical protein
MRRPGQRERDRDALDPEGNRARQSARASVVAHVVATADAAARTFEDGVHSV